MEARQNQDSVPLDAEKISTPVQTQGAEDSLARLMSPEGVQPGSSALADSPSPGLLLQPVAPRKRSRLLRLSITGTKLLLPLAVCASLCFNYSEVRGASMMPGIQDHDRILVDHVTYAFSSISRGDVIVMRYPLNPNMDYIKRVVGLPGDEVVVQHGGVWVNGEPVEEPYVNVKSLDPFTTVRAIVKPGHYFVLGDNRIRSSDSREFGQVAQELVRGLVRLRVWPPERIGWIR